MLLGSLLLPALLQHHHHGPLVLLLLLLLLLLLSSPLGSCSSGLPIAGHGLHVALVDARRGRGGWGLALVSRLNRGTWLTSHRLSPRVSRQSLHSLGLGSSVHLQALLLHFPLFLPLQELLLMLLTNQLLLLRAALSLLLLPPPLDDFLVLCVEKLREFVLAQRGCLFDLAAPGDEDVSRHIVAGALVGMTFDLDLDTVDGKLLRRHVDDGISNARVFH
mmetsp:Transcript_81576/g.170647  ORF Transcript_81576/g.170647 Transcript_81576/m.170647 type:complete len:219 (-) Transcript_81576:1081-1737(-)